MNDDALNQSIRQFLKNVGIHSQREIEKAAAAATGGAKFPATMTLSVPGLKLEVKFEGEIRLE